MKKLIAIIVLAIVSANTYGQYVTPVGTAQWFKKNVYFGSDTTNANAIIRTNGKVGIGTSNPTETLTVNGSISTKYTNSGHNYITLSNSFGHGLAVQDSATGIFESQVAISSSDITIANFLGIQITQAFYVNFDENYLILGFGNSSLNNKSNTIRFDSTSKFCVGIDASIYTPNMQWVDSNYTPRASIYNNGYMQLGSASAPQQTLDVAGNAKIDSSLILQGEYYTATDSVFTIPNNISTVIINSATGFDAATITMPPNPYNGQIISIAVGDYGIGTLTISPNSGQAVSSGTPVLHNGSISYRYRMANSTWYRW